MCKRTVKTLNSLLFFLVRRVKRARHENDHARDWRRERGDTRKGRLSLFFSATALASRVLRFCRSMLARKFTPLAKSKENELLLAVNGKSSGSSNFVLRILLPSRLHLSRLAGFDKKIA